MSCLLILGMLAAYWAAHPQDAPAPAQNAVSSPQGGVSGFLSGSDDPSAMEPGEGEEPELVELRDKQSARRGTAPGAARTPAAPAGRR